MKAFKIIVISTLLLPALFISCNFNSEKKLSSGGSDEQVVTDITEKDAKEYVVYYRFPSPDEVFSLIDKSKLDYNSGLLNFPQNYKLYLNVKDRTLNLGCYIADLAYITMFEQHEASMDYFDVINQLSGQLRISDAFHESLYKRISKNLDNVDSLIVISGLAYGNIVDYLTETDQENLLSLISIGVYIESLYLILFYVDEYDPKSELLKMIIDQKFAVDNLYDYTNQYSMDENVKQILPDLKEIKDILDSVDNKIVTKPQVKNDNKILVISGGTELSITEKQFEKLKKTVNQVRKNIVRNN